MLVRVPVSFKPEREYVLSVLLTEFLGIDFKLEKSEEYLNYSLVLPNGNELIVQDHFFSRISETEGYLHARNIPSSVLEMHQFFGPEFPCLLLYGLNEVIDNNEQKGHRKIEIGADIFASTFFMLTRWEEQVITTLDKHQRVDENLHLGRKLGFHKRPIVNEYADLLFCILQTLGYEGKRPARNFEFVLTHDVDQIARFDTFKKYVSAIGGDILLRRNPLLVPRTTIDFLAVRTGMKKDNYDTFDYIMDLADEHSITSRFYFIPGALGENDFRYDVTSSRVGEIIENISKRNHVVGIHGSYDSYNDRQTFSTELKRLQDLGLSIKEGRQHYLRFENPATWQIWDDCNLEVDSTIGFHSSVGFRAGVCFSYSTFNTITRKKLKLKERPLIVMEAPLLSESKSHQEVLSEVTSLIRAVRRHKGEFVFLWHPNNLFHPAWLDHVKTFEASLSLKGF